MAEVKQYRGYELVTVSEPSGWGAWILSRNLPQGRVRGCATPEEALAAAQREVEQRQQRERQRS